MDEIYPYVKSTGAFHCPDDSGQNGSTGYYVPYTQLPAGDPNGTNNHYYGSYGMNSSYYNNHTPLLQGPGNYPGWTIGTIASPSTVIWIADGDGSYQIDWGGDANNAGFVGTQVYNGYTEVGTTKVLGDGALCFRHGGPDIANVLFCDGHVKALNAGQATVSNKESDGNVYDYLFICNGA
jgi:prepilin-type processing-associated H-X9-DG protein